MPRPLVYELRSRRCRKLFGKVFTEEDGKKYLSFKCYRCSKRETKKRKKPTVVYHNFSLDYIESAACVWVQPERDKAVSLIRDETPTSAPEEGGDNI